MSHTTTEYLVYRGDTFKGVINLRLRDSLDKYKVNPFVIEAGSTIEVRFPGQTSPVVLSSTIPGEITILDTTLSSFSFEGSPTKSLLLKKISDSSVTVVVTQGVSGEIFTFEKERFLTIKDRSN
jgi:hypothetical protein